MNDDVSELYDSAAGCRPTRDDQGCFSAPDDDGGGACGADSGRASKHWGRGDDGAQDING